MLESLRGLGPYLRRHRRPMALGIACAAVADLCSVIPPLLLGKAVDFLEVASKAGETDRFGTLALFAAAFVGVVAFGGVFAWAMRRLMTGTSRRIEADLQQDLFCHLMRVPPATHDRLRGGDLISRLTNDVAAVREVLGPGIMWSIQTGTQLLLVAAFMLAISPSLTVYALAPLPLLLLVTVWASRGIHRHSYAAQESLSNLSQRATTAFSGIRVVQVFRREAAERADFAAIDTSYVKEMLAQARVRALFLPAMTGLPGIALAAVLWAGGHATIADELSKGQLLTFLFYVVMLVRPMLYLGWAVTIHQRGAAALERLREVLRELPEDLGGDREPDGAVEGRLAWTACTVGYQADRPVLQTLDLAITPGEFCAVVGPIASG
jgi:ATP-binding cassette subfamily B protein